MRNLVRNSLRAVPQLPTVLPVHFHWKTVGNYETGCNSTIELSLRNSLKSLNVSSIRFVDFEVRIIQNMNTYLKIKILLKE